MRVIIITLLIASLASMSAMKKSPESSDLKYDFQKQTLGKVSGLPLKSPTIKDLMRKEKFVYTFLYKLMTERYESFKKEENTLSLRLFKNFLKLRKLSTASYVSLLYCSIFTKNRDIYYYLYVTNLNKIGKSHRIVLKDISDVAFQDEEVEDKIKE